MSYQKLTPIVATGSTVPRYIPDRFAEYPSVLDFGAKGDGITDDTAAFQAAAAAHDYVFVPSGTYLVASDVSGVFLMAEGAETTGAGFICKANICRVDLEKSVTLPVGAGQDFTTLTDAIDFAYKHYKPAFNTANARVNIVLKTGFVMSEQLVFDSVDCSFMKITSEDETVEVDCSGFNVQDSEHRYPLVLCECGGKSPVVGVLFVVPEEDEYTGVLERVEGFFAGHFGEVLLAPGAGIRNAERGIACLYGGRASCTLGELTTQEAGAGTEVTGVDLTGCRGRAVFCAHQGYANLPRTKASGSGDGGCCVYAIWNSFINIYQSDFSNANGTAVYVRDASVVCARECNVSGASGNGFHALHTARIDARYHATKWTGYDENDPTVPHGAQNCGNHAVCATFASHIDCSELPCDGAGGTSAILCSSGSTVSAVEGVTISNSKRAIEVETGGAVIASNAVVNNIQYTAMQCQSQGGRIIADHCTMTNCGAAALAEYGGYIDISYSTGSGFGASAYVVTAKSGSTALCVGATIDGGSRAVEAYAGSTIIAVGATIKNCSDRGISAIDSGRVQARGVTIQSSSNIANDVNCNGGYVEVVGASLLAPTPNIRAQAGGIVQASGVTVSSGASLIISPTANTVSSSGLVFN